MDDVERRAPGIFAAYGGWPSGLCMPSRLAMRGSTPEEVAAIRERIAYGQRTVVAWAERYGLRASDRGCCPRWLGRGSVRSCNPSPTGKCGRYGAYGHPDYPWMDHSIAWYRDRKPVALTSAPYGVSGTDRRRLDFWIREDPHIRVVTGTGWYGLGTTQIVMWRADRIGTLEAA